MDSISINAVVVTYNRVDLLKKCINKLLCQTYKLNKIVIINNASTDGTKEYLNRIKENDIFDIIFLKKNIGGAGGFHHGIKRAYELGCDYIWIMDDDTLADENSLKILVSSLSVFNHKKIGFLASNVLYKDNTPCVMNISKTVKNWNEYIDKGIVEISHTSFVAMLIPSNVVKEVGLPIKEYFIWGDDAEYSTRILRKGYKGYQIGKSFVHHYMNENIGVDIFNSSKERINRFFYFYRNVTITDRMKGITFFIPRLGYHLFIILKILFCCKSYRLLKSWIVLKGTVCGMFKKVKIEYI